jgi:hypothetical protein
MALLRKSWSLAWLVVACQGRLGAQHPSDASAILDRALKAKGGVELLSKYKGHIARGQGILHDDGHRIHFRYEYFVQNFERSRAQMTFVADGIQIRSVVLINQDGGWIKNGEQVQPMPQDRLDVEKAGLYLTKVTSLLPLKSPRFKLTALGKVTVQRRDAVGLKVSCPGARDVDLYFDRSTWLLLKAQQPIVKLEDNLESMLEMYPSHYRPIRQIQVPFKIVLRYGEMPYAEYSHTEADLVALLDDRLFTMPATPGLRAFEP